MHKPLLAFLFSVSVMVSPLLAVGDPNNPDWPCVQKKIENLSVSAIWNGPPIDEFKNSGTDQKISSLVTKLASRRVPIEKALTSIDEYAKSYPDTSRNKELAKLFAALFETVNTQRKSVINGIEKYQRSQKARADELEKQGVDIAKLKGDIVVDDTAAEPLSPEEDKLYWAGRIFQERQANIPIACELPSVIEERLYELSRHIQELITK